ncbi:hypothetical protein DYB26_013530 [Aphanomyces astaci]|uniref:CCZ1/INTU/HSP4 first Longin domain-containing protein n=1 Tax=Aphanomyces astaci TaxID=112090 RepID=A0A418FWE8_APHAT|nr:hypothetical protein DYB26_013530 [Aphanomyces astaci]
MEVVVWHEDLGSDDDAATEEESFARILYCWPPKSMQEQLRVLQLLQGVYAFSSRFSSSPTTVTHVQLTNMHYCFERVEPKVDLFVDAISSSSSSSAKDDTAARGFQAADGRFDADIAPDKLWRLPLFFDSTDVKSTADLIVWHVRILE